MSRTRRILLVVAILGAAIGTISLLVENDDTADRPVAATTTTRPPAPTVDPDELTAAERACADNWPTISYIELRRMKADRSIDGIYDWSGGYWVSYAKIMDIC